MVAPACNTVPIPPQGLIVAIQYWAGDEVRALRLARLLADIEPVFRDDVTIALCRRFDMGAESALLWETWNHCARKFRVAKFLANREGTGHPRGCNELWSSCMEHFSAKWRAGNLWAHSIFTCEPDGVPLRADWIGRLKQAHRRTLDAGRRITGPLMQEYPHINGSIIAHLSLWFDRPSLHRTPSDQSWDMFHEHVIRSEALPSPWIKNVYGESRWSADSLFNVSRETAWLCSQKDDTAIGWAERYLVATTARAARDATCACPDPYHCKVDACPCSCSSCRGPIARATLAAEKAR
jgi:hypothetical protein